MALVDAFSAIRSYLLADAAVSASVGGNRIYPLKMPQGETGSSIVLSRISAVGDHTNDGPVLLGRIRYQVDCYALTFGACADLALAVKSRLDGVRGTLSGISVKGIFFDSERDGYEPETEFYRVSQDFIVWHDEG